MMLKYAEDNSSFVLPVM